MLRRLRGLLRNKAASDFLSLFVGQYGGLACTFIFSIVLTRLLDPADFGLYASLFFLLNLFQWVTEWGWDDALMAHKEIPLQVAASTHLVIRCVLGSIPLVFLPLFTWLTGYSADPQAVSLLRWFAVSYLLESISTHRVILERNSELKTLAFLELGAHIVGSASAAIAALHGWGVFSLVLGDAVEDVIELCGYIIGSRWRWGFSFSWDVAFTFFKSFGIASWLGGVFGLAIYSFMPFLIGQLADLHQAGLYERAFSLGTFPLMLSAVCNRITTPLYTQCQFMVPSLRKYFVKVQTYKLILLVPMQLLLAIGASWWIPLAFGPSWIALVPVYRIMACYGFIRSFFDDVCPLVTLGFKNPWELTKTQIVQSIFIVTVAPLVVSQFGAIGGSLVMTAAMALAAALFWRGALTRVRCSWKRFLALARSAISKPGVLG